MRKNDLKLLTRFLNQVGMYSGFCRMTKIAHHLNVFCLIRKREFFSSLEGSTFCPIRGKSWIGQLFKSELSSRDFF